MSGERLCETGWPTTASRCGSARPAAGEAGRVTASGPGGRRRGDQARRAGEVEAPRELDLVGLLAHVLREDGERAGGLRDLDGPLVERARARALHHLGLEHVAVGGDRHVDDQRAEQLAAVLRREVAGAALLDALAQG